MIGFYRWVSDPFLGSKKIITWFFNQVFEERISVFILGSRILPLDIEDDGFLSSARFYPQVKEDYYLVFQPSLEEKISVFIRGSQIGY
jgi:hypothetical protein